jgi:hypothetical protein
MNYIREEKFQFLCDMLVAILDYTALVTSMEEAQLESILKGVNLILRSTSTRAHLQGWVADNNKQSLPYHSYLIVGSMGLFYGIRPKTSWKWKESSSNYVNELINKIK